MPPTHALHITPPGSADGGSPEHKRLKVLMDKIDRARQRLQQWQEQLPLFAQSYAQRVKPELESLHKVHRQWLFDMEELLLRGRWSRSERETLTEHLLDACGQLMVGTAGGIDVEVKALHDRHAELDFDSAEREDAEVMKALLQEVTGVDLGDQEFASADDLMRHAQEQWGRARAGEGENGGEVGPQSDTHGPGSGRNRKKGHRRQTAAQRRAEAEAKQSTQTVREVYRKLAAALHPDRSAVGATPEQQAERTELMQRANGAYENNDLLALLTLQLQIEQVSLQQAQSMAASQVRQLNKLLAEQVREIEEQVQHLMATLEGSYGLELPSRQDPMGLGKVLTMELAGLQAQRLLLDRERRALCGPAANAKRYLKSLRAMQRSCDDDPFFF